MPNIIITSSCSEDRCATAWDSHTGSVLNVYKSGNDKIAFNTLQVLRDCYLLAADSTKPRLHLWPLNSQFTVPYLRLSTPGKVSALSCSPVYDYAVAGINEKLYVWKLSTGQLLNTLSGHFQTVTRICFNADGSCFASAAEDNLILVWSLSQCIDRGLSEDYYKPLRSYSDHSRPVKDICFGSFSNHAILCSVSLDKTLKVYDISADTLIISLIFNETLTAVCMDPMENFIFVGCVSGSIKQINLREPPRTIEHHVQKNISTIFRTQNNSMILTLSVSDDGLQLLSGDKNGNVCIWDIATGMAAKTIFHKGSIAAAFFGKSYKNYSVNKIKPSIIVAPLQWTSNEVKDEATGICEDVGELFLKECEIQLLHETGFDQMGEVKKMSQEIEQMRKTMDELKAINHSLYKFCVENQLPKQIS